MYAEKKFGALSSSVDPAKLATTVQGVIKAIGGALAFFGLSAVVGDVNTLAVEVGQLVTTGFAFWGVVETVYGLLRKIVVAVSKR